MQRSKILFAVLVVLLASGAVFTLYGAGEETPDNNTAGFPAAGVDLIDHEVRIGLHQVDSDGTTGALLETLEFDGRIMVERGDPYTNSDGFRQIDFEVTDWQATAWSEILGSLVTYGTDDATEQPLSWIVAQQQGVDFPATFVFNLYFDASVYGAIFFHHHHGRPEGHDFFEVPPSGNRPTSPTMTIFETDTIEFDHPEHGTLRFVPIDCNDSKGTTIHTFTESEKADLKLVAK